MKHGGITNRHSNGGQFSGHQSGDLGSIEGMGGQYGGLEGSSEVYGGSEGGGREFENPDNSRHEYSNQGTNENYGTNDINREIGDDSGGSLLNENDDGTNEYEAGTRQEVPFSETGSSHADDTENQT